MPVPSEDVCLTVVYRRTRLLLLGNIKPTVTSTINFKNEQVNILSKSYPPFNFSHMIPHDHDTILVIMHSKTYSPSMCLNGEGGT